MIHRLIFTDLHWFLLILIQNDRVANFLSSFQGLYSWVFSSQSLKVNLRPGQFPSTAVVVISWLFVCLLSGWRCVSGMRDMWELHGSCRFLEQVGTSIWTAWTWQEHIISWLVSALFLLSACSAAECLVLFLLSAWSAQLSPCWAILIDLLAAPFLRIPVSCQAPALASASFLGLAGSSREI